MGQPPRDMDSDERRTQDSGDSDHMIHLNNCVAGNVDFSLRTMSPFAEVFTPRQNMQVEPQEVREILELNPLAVTFKSCNSVFKWNVYVEEFVPREQGSENLCA